MSLALVQYDPATAAKCVFSINFFGGSIKSLGTSKHEHFVSDADTGKVFYEIPVKLINTYYILVCMSRL